jgi:hypothetical protein
MEEWQENQVPTLVERPEHWVIYIDRSLKLEGTSAEVLLISPRENNSSTSYKSSGRCPTTKLSKVSTTQALLDNLSRHQTTHGLQRLQGGPEILTRRTCMRTASKCASSRTNSLVSSSTTSSMTTTLLWTSCQSWDQLEHKS